jgi:hypothetical protein
VRIGKEFSSVKRGEAADALDLEAYKDPAALFASYRENILAEIERNRKRHENK